MPGFLNSYVLEKTRWHKRLCQIEWTSCGRQHPLDRAYRNGSDATSSGFRKALRQKE